MIPLPNEDTTPPVTNMYLVSTTIFVLMFYFAKIVQAERITKWIHSILYFQGAACLIKRQCKLSEKTSKVREKKDLSVFSEPQLALSKNKMKQNECNSNFVSGSFSEAQPVLLKDSASWAKKKELAQFFIPKCSPTCQYTLTEEQKNIFFWRLQPQIFVLLFFCPKKVNVLIFTKWGG